MFTIFYAIVPDLRTLIDACEAREIIEWNHADSLRGHLVVKVRPYDPYAFKRFAKRRGVTVLAKDPAGIGEAAAKALGYAGVRAEDTHHQAAKKLLDNLPYAAWLHPDLHS